MKNMDRWQPSKFVFQNGKLKASKDSSQLNPASRLYVNLVAEAFQTTLVQHACGRLIDLGCGKMPLYQAYHELVDNILCTDYQASSAEIQYVDFTCDLSKPLPIRENTFDTLILADVLEHIPNPDLIWNEMSRILKKKGKILLSVPFYYGIHDAPDDYYRYTEHALRRFATLSGLEVIVFKTLGGSPEIVADLLAKHATAIPLIGNAFVKIVQTITLAFVRQGLGKWISDKSKLYFPIGYFLIVEKLGREQ